MKLNGIYKVYSITEPDKIIAIISKNLPGDRVNLTAENQILQASFINFGRNKKVGAHSHLKIQRNTIGTQEVWVILKGRAEVSFYDLDNMLIYSTIITKGQVIIIFDGGHAMKTKSRAFTMVEVKNGPYLGKDYDSVQIK